ncbi:MAG: AMP-binding protein [Proteobacteria bacterium]|nr:AMP-binding protein [Pseudomonadota bacterium]
MHHTWQTWTWSEMAKEIKILACALAAKGFKRNDKLGIIGNNRARLYWSMAAAQCLGGIPVPLYQDSTANEIIGILIDSDVSFIVVEDQEQVDKILEIWDKCPLIRHVVYEDPRGMFQYNQPFLNDFESMMALGRRYDREHPDFFLQEVDKGSGEDVGVFLFTSGTTGKPKGVVMTYNNIIITARNTIELEKLSQKDELIAYLPMAWVGDYLFSFAQSYVAGFCVNCPENTETIEADRREIGPSYYFGPPPIWENLLTRIMIRMEDAFWVQKKVFHFFMGVAKKTGARILNKESVSLLARWLYAVGDILIYAPLKNALGISNVRLAYTAGEAIGPDLFDFYRSLGINIKQLYGQTEAFVFVCIQPDGEIYSDTVGIPAPEVEVKITKKGEVMYRSPGVFHSYYKNPESTADTKTPDGWVYTGDAGFFDARGHLKIIDRIKDVGKFSSGELFAPKYIENKLKFFPHIKEVVAFGNDRDFATAFICIDMNAVGDWAERLNLSYSGYASLAGHEAVYQLIRESIEKMNKDLALDEKLRHSQVKRFLLLHKELDADDGELTRTRKVRRKFINEKYPVLIEALYSNKDICRFEAKVKFEDGRTGIIAANLKIWKAALFGSDAVREEK